MPELVRWNRYLLLQVRDVWKGVGSIWQDRQQIAWFPSTALSVNRMS